MSSLRFARMLACNLPRFFALLVLAAAAPLGSAAANPVVEMVTSMGTVRIELYPDKAPKTVDFIDALPRSAVGKVLKKDLRAEYWRGTARRI